MKAIQFPIDFEIYTNPYLRNSTNYTHTRPDGSCISILQKDGTDYYEVWDKQYMEYPEIMDYTELQSHLSSTLSQLLTYRFFNTEDLQLN